MRIEAEERLEALLIGLGTTLQEIAEANAALETNGVEASMIRIPRAYIMGIPLEFADVDKVDVAHEYADGSIVAYVAEKPEGNEDE